MSSEASDALVQATVSKFQSLADGTIRLQVDVHHGDTDKAKDMVCEVGAPIVVARLREATIQFQQPDAGNAEEPEQPATREPDPLTGQILKAFYTNGFWHNPRALKSLGTDEELLEWCRRQTCWHCDKVDMNDEGHPYVQAAHVRRVWRGSGVARKPPFSAIPLCNACHSIQHAVGETGLAPQEWWEAKAAQVREMWGHEKLRDIFGTDSVSRDVSADDLWVWLRTHDLLRFVPKKVQHDVEQRQRERASGSSGRVGPAPVVEG